MYTDIAQKFNWKFIVAGIIVVILALSSFEVVPSGSRGLIFNGGTLSDKVAEQGLVMKIPVIQTVQEISIQPQTIDITIAVGADGAITKDNQTIGATLAVFFKYKEKDLVNMYKEFGEKTIHDKIQKDAKEGFKQVIGNYQIFEVSGKQEEIRKKAFDIFLQKLGNYPVDIVDFKVTNYDWSDDFDNQIKATMQKAQEVKQKEQEKLIAEQEAQKGVVAAEAQKTIAITQAEAAKQKAITEAEGDKEAAKLRADAKALEGEGIKKYNQSVAQNWDIELQKMRLEIEKIKADKWNGVYVPNNMYGPIPFDSVGGIKGN